MGGSTYVGASHLEFNKKPLEKDRKMHKYEVRNKSMGGVIGEIHWRGGWRQYVFQATMYNPYDIEKINGIKYIRVEDMAEIDMSRSCHKEINKFMGDLMKEWRENLKKKNEKEDN